LQKQKYGMVSLAQPHKKKISRAILGGIFKAIFLNFLFNFAGSQNIFSHHSIFFFKKKKTQSFDVLSLIRFFNNKVLSKNQVRKSLFFFFFEELGNFVTSFYLFML